MLVVERKKKEREGGEEENGRDGESKGEKKEKK